MKNNRFLIVAGLFLVLTISLSLSESPTDIIYTDKGNYVLGEPVAITLNYTDFTNTRLEIVSLSKRFSYLDLVNNVIFIPKEEGEHIIQFFKDQDLIAVSQFYVGDMAQIDQSSLISSISTDKSNYSIGETVTITVATEEDISKLTLQLSNNEKDYNFFNLNTNTIRFLPVSQGKHVLLLLKGNENLSESVFYVSDENGTETFLVEPSIETPPINETQNQEQQEPIEENQPEIFSLGKTQILEKEIFVELNDSAVRIRNKKGDNVNYKLFILNKTQDIKQGTSASPFQTNRQRVIMDISYSSIKKIDFRNLELNNASALKIDELEYPKEINNVLSIVTYAIDPSQLIFDNASVTATAKGTELWKCRDWDFEAQLCFGSWVKLQDITPGENYTFLLTALDPGFAETGVASINTKKPIYHPGETVELIMVVLDKFGYLVKGANIILRVTDPENNEYLIEKVNESSKGVYVASFDNALLEGDYTLFISAKGENYDSNMTSFFLVSSVYDFDIIRKTPVTIDPKQGSFESEITITSYGYDGYFNFTEVIPRTFTVELALGAVITEDENNIYLTWLNLKNSSTVYYTLKAPEISPNLHILGPSFISYDFVTFYEARPWYLAIDPALGSPVSTLSFFMNDYSAGRSGNYGVTDNDDFGEIPIEMNDYSYNSEKCGTWNCTAWSSSGLASRPEYCSGGYNCTSWNGNSCDTWTCVTWTRGGTNARLNYCSGGWNCTRYNGTACAQWGCITWTAGTAADDRYCSGIWNCTSWNGRTCSNWACPTWSDGATAYRDYYCSGGRNCTRWNGNDCTNWNCLTTTRGAADYFDYYCSGVWECQSWNGNVCRLWKCPTWTAGAIVSYDYSCDAWNCTTWNTTTELCEGWTCLRWVASAQYQDGYCSGNYDCTRWIDLNKEPNVSSLNYPADTANFSNSLITFNFTAFDDWYPLQNCSIYMNISGWTLQGTSYNVPNGTNTNITLNVSEGRYIWNVICFDNAATPKEDWYDSNYTVTIDRTGPITTITDPVNFSNITTTTFYSIAASASDNLVGVDSVSFYYRALSTNPWIYISSDNTVSYRATWDVSSLGDGNSYQLQAYGNDTLGNIGGNYTVGNITLDRTGPVTTITDPVNFTNISASSYTIQATSVDALKQVSAVTMMYRTSPLEAWTLICMDTSSPYSCSWDLSSLADGNSYQLQAYGNDTLGNIGGNYTVGNITLDRTGPVTTITDPVNFTNISASSYTIQATSVDALKQVSAVTMMYRTSPLEAWTLICMDTSSPYSCSWDLSSLADGNSYQLLAYGNDTLGNIGGNYTVGNITIDRTGPVTTITQPLNFSNITGDTYLVQMTSSDSFSRIDTVTIIYRQTPSGSFSILCRDTSSPYECTWSISSFSEGNSYELRAYANDSLNNLGLNYTVGNISIIKPPVLNNILPAQDTSYNISVNVTISANITDFFGISSAYVNVTLPNGIIQRVSLSPSGGNNYTAIFSNLTMQGRYNLTFYANDSRGAINAINTTYFNRIVPNNKLIDLVGINLSYFDYNITVLSNSSGILTISIRPLYLAIKEIIIYGFNENGFSGPIIMQNSTNDASLFSRTYMLDLSLANFSYANVTVTAIGGYLFKCTDFNSTSMMCNDPENYIQINSTLIEGQNFTFILNSTDPGFGETIQGQVNISDSYMYQASANTNNGGSASLIVGKGNAAGRAYRSIIWFNVSYLPSGIQVRSANLSLYFYSITAGDNTSNRTHAIHKVNQTPIRPWTETGVTWNSYNGTVWTNAGGDYNLVATDTQTFNGSRLNTWIKYNVTLDVDLFKNDSSKNFGWIIKENTEASTLTRRYYYSKNFGTAANRPYLEIYYEDIQPPGVILDPPDNTTNTTLSTITLYYNVSENIGISNCSLYLNYQLNITNITIYNNQRNNFTLYNVGDNLYYWNVSCYDTSGLVNSSGLKNFRVDRTGPITNITDPVNFTNITDNTYNIQVTATDSTAVDTAIFLYRRLPTDGWTQACTDNTLPYRCTWDVTSLAESDSYQIRAYSNDTLGNIGANFTVYNISIIRPPVFSSVYPSGQTYNITANVTISAIITDFFGISRAYVNITLPNGEIRLLELSSGANNNYTGVYTNLSFRGRYNLSFFANSTRGIENSSVTSYFIRAAPGNKLIDIVNRDLVYFDYNTSVLGNNSGILNVSLTLHNYNVKQIIMFNHNERSPYSIIRFENYTADSGFFDKSYMLDLSAVNFTTANVTATSTNAGYHLMKCTDFNLQSLTCNDEYELYQEGLVDGQNYTFILNATDPGFGETIQGQANISDSYMRQGRVNTNYGGATNLRIGKSTASDAHRPIIWFNVSYLPQGIQIVSANVSLYFYSIISGDALDNRTHNIHRVQQSPSRPWTETGVTWNSFNGTAWSSAGGDYIAQATDSQTFNNSRLNSFIVYNITSDAQLFSDNRSSNFGWLIKDSDETTLNTRRDYRSSEYAANTSQRPKLDIYYEDIMAPGIIIDLPANNSYTKQSTVTFYYNITENIGISNCSLYLNYQLNRTNTTIYNNQRNNFTLYNVGNDIYSWYITCYDTSALSNTSTAKILYVDTILPAIHLGIPSNGQLLGRTLNFTFTPVDNLGYALNCSLMINSIINQTDIVTNNNSLVNLQKTFSTDATYYWNVSCTDNATNTNTSETRSFTVNTIPPIPTLIEAIPNYTGLGQKIIIRVNATDADGIEFIRANVTKPDGEEIVELKNVSGITFEGLFNNTWNIAVYNYTIWTRDLLGNENISRRYNFSINSSLSINIKTTQDIYGPNAEVNLTKANSDWWDSSYLYRQKINLTVSSGATPRDYQTKITLNTASVGSNFNWTRACEDIRFVNASDNTELGYWIESCDSAGKTASIWVKIRNNITTSMTSIYMYYGNQQVLNKSNGTATFDFYDDFSGDLSKWTIEITSGVYPRIENQYMVAGGGSTAASPYGHTSLGSSATYSGFQNGIIEGRLYLTTDSIAEIAFRGNYAGGTGYKSRIDARAGQGLSFLLPPYSSWGFVAGCAVTGTPPSTSTWLDFYQSASGNSFNVTVGTLSRVCTDSTYSSAGEIAIQNHYGSYTYYDNIRVRKLASSEPVISILNEEGQTASSIQNTGRTNSSGYLMMMIDSNVTGSWVYNYTVVNDTNTRKLRNITNNTLLDLVSIWNGPNEGSGWNTGNTASGYYRARVELTDNNGNVLRDSTGTYLNSTYTFYVDITPPIWYILNSSNTTPAPSTIVYFSANWTDNLGLGNWQFFWKIEGDPSFTLQDSGIFGGSYNWSVASKTIPGSAEGKIIEYYFKAFDGQGAAASTNISSITVKDVTNPIIASPSVTPLKIYINDSVTLSATITDNIAMSRGWANITRPDGSSQIIALTNISDQYSAIYSNTTIVGRYNITIYANDTYNNLGSSTLLQFDTYGRSNITFISPVGGNYPVNSYLDLICKVTDHNTSSPLGNYLVNYYANNTLIGSNLTNSTGQAVRRWTVSGIGYTLLNCTIANSTANYYDALFDNANSSINILVPNITLKRVEHPNNMTYSIDEYETYDLVGSVNVTSNNTGGANSTFVTTRLNVINSQGASAPWFTEQANSCGNLTVGQQCTTQFNNSNNGYNITALTATGLQQWNITFNWSNGGISPNNFRRDFLVYHVPDNLTARLNRSELTPSENTKYILNITNPWSKNLTGFNVTINCPSATGLSCSCYNQTGTKCAVGNIGNRSLNIIIFNITTTGSTPLGEYGINITIEYLNPGNTPHLWREIKGVLLQIKPLVAFIVNYPNNFTRGDSFNLTGYAINIGGSTINALTLNWTLPSGWTNISGGLNSYTATLGSNEKFWNNITVNTSQAVQLGINTILLKTYSPDANYDDDTVNIIVYARTNISNISVSNQNPFRGDTIRIYAKLVWDNSSDIVNQTLIFQTTYTNTTNTTGWAQIPYQIPSWAPLGSYSFRINVSYPGNSTIFTLDSSSFINISIRDRINISAIADPIITGYGQQVRINSNISSGIQIDKAKANITLPDNTKQYFNLYNTSSILFTGLFNSTWKRGYYNFTVYANNTGGFENESGISRFEIRANATLNLSTVSVLYGANQVVNLSATDTNIVWWNDSFRYRKLINLSENSGSALNLFQINLSVDTSTLISEGKMNSNCSDIRFTNNGLAELNYYIESGCNSASTIIWVKANLTASTITPIYMYYGYSSAANVSNATNTFDYFDASDQLSSWTAAGASGQSVAQGNPIPSYYAASQNTNYMYKNIGLTTQRIVDFDVRSDGLGNFYFLVNAAGAGQHFRAETRGSNYAGIANTTSWIAWSAPTGCANIATNTWYNFRLVIESSTAQAYINGATCGTPASFTNNGGYIGLIGDGLGAGSTTWWDNIRVRKYASSMPTFYSGSEETYNPNSFSSVYDYGSTNISGYLVMYVERNNSNIWTPITTVVNDTQTQKKRNITLSASLSLTPIWNGPGEGAGFNTLTRQTSQYRITSLLTDPSGILLTNDDGSNITGYAYFWIDTTAPTVINIAPINDTWLRYQLINFSYLPNDTSLSNCSLWGNWSDLGWHLNETNTSPITEITNYFGPKTIPEGNHIWGVQCYDMLANSAFSSTYKLHVDVTAPSIILTYPADNDNVSYGNINFTFTADDALTAILNCSLFINNQLIVSNLSAQRGIAQGYVYSIYTAGLYNWTLNCTDIAGNSFRQNENNFTVIAGPLNLGINLTSNNRSVVLNWSATSYAESYSIFITTNYTAGFLSTPNATGITSLNWTDNNAFDNERRYYKVAAVKGNAYALSSQTLGKHTLQLYRYWNLISSPFNLSNWNLYNGTAGRDIFTDPGDCIFSLWRYNASNKNYQKTDYISRQWIPATGSGSESFVSIEPGRGYWAEVNRTCNLTLFGIVPVQNITLGLETDWNMMGHYSAKDPLLGEESLTKTIDVTPTDSVIAINRFNPIRVPEPDFEVTIHYPTYGWFPSWDNPDFTDMTPMRGYYFTLTQKANWTHDPSKG